MTAPRARRRRLVLADDGIIDLIAVQIAARRTRTIAATRAALRAAGGPPLIASAFRSRLRLTAEQEAK